MMKEDLFNTVMFLKRAVTGHASELARQIREVEKATRLFLI